MGGVTLTALSENKWGKKEINFFFREINSLALDDGLINYTFFCEIKSSSGLCFYTSAH